MVARMGGARGGGAPVDEGGGIFMGGGGGRVDPGEIDVRWASLQLVWKP